MWSRTREKANTLINKLGNVDPDEALPSYREPTGTGNVVNFKSYEALKKELGRAAKEHRAALKKKWDYEAEVEQTRQANDVAIRSAEYRRNTARDVLQQFLEQSFDGDDDYTIEINLIERGPPDPIELDVSFETPPTMPEGEQ